jgi:hypothetical protein
MSVTYKNCNVCVLEELQCLCSTVQKLQCHCSRRTAIFCSARIALPMVTSKYVNVLYFTHKRNIYVMLEGYCKRSIFTFFIRVLQRNISENYFIILNLIFSREDYTLKFWKNLFLTSEFIIFLPASPPPRGTPAAYFI